MVSITQGTGKAAEKKALDYLSRQGLKLVAQNYNCPLGEVDLIMRDRTYFVFIEVRYRMNNSFGTGIVSITPAKRKKIMNASSHYLMKHNIYDKDPLRFDVISIDGYKQEITWVKDAFGVDY